MAPSARKSIKPRSHKADFISGSLIFCATVVSDPPHASMRRVSLRVARSVEPSHSLLTEYLLFRLPKSNCQPLNKNLLSIGKVTMSLHPPLLGNFLEKAQCSPSEENSEKLPRPETALPTAVRRWLYFDSCILTVASSS